MSAKARVTQLKREMHGHANNIRHVAPPQTSQRPWYPLLVDFIEPNAGVAVMFAPSDIITTLVNQLGLPTQASAAINIKLRRADVYAMPTGASTNRPSCNLDASSISPSLGDPATPGSAEVFYGIMKKLADTGNLSDAAKCSYTWPAAMAEIPMSFNSNFQVLATAGNVANVLTRFHVMWSTTDVAPPKVISF